MCAEARAHDDFRNQLDDAATTADPAVDPIDISQPTQPTQPSAQQQRPQQRQRSTNFVWRNNRRPLQHDENGRWICDICGKVYTRGDSLAHHRSIHRGDTVCPVCQVVFTRKYTMKCHMANVHGIQSKSTG